MCLEIKRFELFEMCQENIIHFTRFFSWNYHGCVVLMSHSSVVKMLRMRLCKTSWSLSNASCTSLYFLENCHRRRRFLSYMELYEYLNTHQTKSQTQILPNWFTKGYAFYAIFIKGYTNFCKLIWYPNQIINNIYLY